MNVSSLFTPFSIKSLRLKNRIVMAPMTRSFSPEGIPGTDVARYYAARAAGMVGLILSEGTVIDRPASSNDPRVPHFYGKQALDGWKEVVRQVHEAGGAMGPQLWHMGAMPLHPSGWMPSAPFEGPSGYREPGGEKVGISMTEKEVEDTIHAYGRAAFAAKEAGFDCTEIHGAHSYLIDQFFWSATNNRNDRYGGKTLAERSRFAAEVIREIRRKVGEDFPVIIRLSQWKIADYQHKMAKTPAEMEAWLTVLADAGVDIFHCSQRRFWEPEFEGSDLNFAGWAKKLTGKPVITVGSVGLSGPFTDPSRGDGSQPTPLDELIRRMERGDFDLVAVGRALLADPEWTLKIKEGNTQALQMFRKDALKQLI